jgi:hypothetical protein
VDFIVVERSESDCLNNFNHCHKALKNEQNSNPEMYAKVQVACNVAVCRLVNFFPELRGEW